MEWVRWGSLMVFLGVALGAFGAHGLNLSPDARQVYQTAVLYQLVHGLGLLAVGWLATLKPGDAFVRHAGWAFVLGIVLFSGSLYLLSVSGIKRLGMTSPPACQPQAGLRDDRDTGQSASGRLKQVVGVITPLGGLAFLFGWVWLALAAR